MLINKSNKIEVGDLATFKIVNGDEIVGTVEGLLEEPGGGYILSNPMTVVPSQKGVGLFPSLMTGKDKATITLKAQHIMMSALTTDELKPHYTQLTTGIVTAPSGIIS
jgi:hypothetical protein